MHTRTRTRVRANVRVVIIANGEPPSPVTVQRWLGTGAILICADGGARVALQLGLRPALAIGDFDSLSADEVKQLEHWAVARQTHAPSKDETDLELALHRAAQMDADEIVVLGALGRRTDHALANISLLAMPALHRRHVILAHDTETLTLLDARLGAAEMLLQGSRGDIVSLLPFGADAEGVTTEGLQYPLRAETLRLGTARGVSNVLTNDTAKIRLQAGLLLCVHTYEITS